MKPKILLSCALFSVFLIQAYGQDKDFKQDIESNTPKTSSISKEELAKLKEEIKSELREEMKQDLKQNLKAKEDLKAKENLKKDTKEASSKRGFQVFEGLKGFAFGRYTANFGRDGKGYAQQWRAILNTKTLDYKGFSLGLGVFFGIGSSIADGANSFDDIGGSRAAFIGRRIGDRFSISQIYGQKEFKHLSIKAGRMNLVTPLSDASLDMGTGIRIDGERKIDIGSFKYQASIYDSWNTDYGFYILSGRGQIGSNGSTSPAFGFGNTMAILGLSYDGYFKARLFYSYANRLYDYMIFSDIAYSHKLSENVSFGLKAQVATLGLNDHPTIKSRSAGAYVINEEFAGANPLFIHAKNRGIYNVNASFKAFSFEAKAGFLGSFEEGYGVLHDGEASIDVPGKIWLSGISATYEGFSFLGSGSKKGTNIYLPYLQFSYTIDSKLKVGLDLVYLGGNNNMPLYTAKGIGHNNKNLPKLWSSLPKGADENVFKAIKIYEITPTISYQMTPNFKFSGYYGTWLGEVRLSRLRVEGRYTF
ncbi:major outer membrane protein [Helicobacter sp. 11S02629-2]|uniref:major outer membrane protein n=1 Tax=Helicobacter sp. 11S02629-2 TaxID=1476195 RepID=UPI000BA7A1B7|nr:major outer membrane protein [Helicobacter sp. 11S02629-2]PAF43118.1 hypothetical protein BKH40_07330 [Helicobacter sp. 11S02629-2]